MPPRPCKLREIERLNQRFIESGNNYVLVGPALGSSDPLVGDPREMAPHQSSRVIVESGMENYRIDPSQGTHFFRTSPLRRGLFHHQPYLDNDGYFDEEFLRAYPAVRNGFHSPRAV